MKDHLTRMLRRVVCFGVVLAFVATAGAGLADAQSAQTNEQAYDALAGNYLLANGNAIGINLFPGDDGKLGLLYADYDSGVVRRLFPVSDDRYGIGPGFAVLSPVELNLRFIKDQRGVVTSLDVQRPGGRSEIARRVQIQAREVTFTSGDAKLSGTLLLPPSQGAHPAIVLLHGSGRLGRWSFGPYPRLFASFGLAVLVYDKRSTGASTGTYLPRDSYYPEVFVNDAIEAVRFLQARDDIDSRRIGLWGTSEGGMLTTQVAARMPNVAFAINSSGFMMPLWEQILYNVEAQLRADGFAPDAVTDALSFRKLSLDVARTGEGWDQFAAAQTAARQKPWWKAYFGADEGMSSLEQLRWAWEHVYSFDPLPALKSVKCPVLGVFGSLDTSTPARGAAENMRRALSDAGNKQVIIRVFDGANHPLMEARTGGNTEIPSLGRFAPGVLETLRSWVSDQIRSQ